MNDNTYAVMEGMEKYVVSGVVSGISAVKWLPVGEGAYTDGKLICLPRPNGVANATELLLWRYYAEHEMGHEDEVNSHPHWKSIMVAHKEDKDCDETFWNIANLLSDFVQERNRIGVMAGRDQVLLEGRLAFSKLDLTHPSIKDGQMLGLGVLDYKLRGTWNPYIAAHPCPLSPTKFPQAFSWVPKFEAAVDILALKNEQEVFDAAKILRKMFPEEKEQSKKSKAAGSSDGGSEKRTGSPSKHSPDKKKELGEGGERPPPTGGTGKQYNVRTPMSVDAACRETGTAHDKRHHRIQDTRQAILGAIIKTNLPAKVRAFLMASRVVKWESGHRSGRLDTNRLTDVLRGKTDIFRRRGETRAVNSAVSLLIDASGSMSGSKYSNACAAGIMLADALQGVGVSVEIAAFTELSNSALVHELIVPFGRRYVRQTAIDKLAELSPILSNNCDGENILYAYHRLKLQKEPRKVLIVLSDGAPAGWGDADNTLDIDTYTQQVIRKVEGDKNVILHAVGIGYNPRMYSRRTELAYGGNMEGTLLALVKKFIASGEEE